MDPSTKNVNPPGATRLPPPNRRLILQRSRRADHGMEASTGPPTPASGGPSRPAARSIYDVLGGDAFFRRLVDSFYARIETDPVLRPLFPPSLEAGKERQFLFLTQFFGGPGRYSALY